MTKAWPLLVLTALVVSACVEVDPTQDEALSIECTFNTQPCSTGVPADGSSRVDLAICVDADDRKPTIPTTVLVSAGQFVTPAPASSTPTQVTVDPGPDGCATATLEVPSAADPLIVTATANTHTTRRDYPLISTAATIEALQFQPLVLMPGSSMKVAAHVQPSAGNVTSGTRVRFEVLEPLDGSAEFQAPVVDVVDGKAEGTLLTTNSTRSVMVGAAILYPTAEPTPAAAVHDVISAPARFELSVAAAGAGQGTIRVTSSPIDCGATCSARFDAGTLVEIVAEPTSNSTFSVWSGGCAGGFPKCQVVIEDDVDVTAVFAAPEYLLTVTLGGDGSGAVTSVPGSINCGGGGECLDSYVEDTQVTLTATPNGSTFGGWSGACFGSVPTCVITMDAAHTVSAAFAQPTP